MRDYLKTYDITLLAKGPVFIGSGGEFSKKEYIREGDYVYIFAIEKLYQELKKRNLQKEYEQFMFQNGITLEQWIRKQHISLKDIMSCIKYSLASGDAFESVNGRKMQIMECMKDGYGNPYVPGSSIKGMLRTIIMADVIEHDRNKYEQDRKEIRKVLLSSEKGKSLLKRNVDQIEKNTYRTKVREGTRKGDAVNDELAGLIIGDSDPLTTDDLVLVQKIDMNIHREKKGLPLIRECIKPGTKIHFTLTIDETVFPYTKDELQDMISHFSGYVYQNFLAKFGSKPPKANQVWLGGGCGYVSKTVTYNLFPENEGVQVVSNIMKKNTPTKHNHGKDMEYKVSPHILKWGKCNGKYLQFGLCEWKFE